MPEYRRRFRKKMNKLNDAIEELSNLTKENYTQTISLFHQYSDESFKEVEDRTSQITQKSKEIQDMSTFLLVMEQPVASDLIIIETSVKITSNLKRIGKLSANMAEIANEIDVEKIPEKPLKSMNHMAQEVGNMLNRSIRSFLSRNAEEAAELEADDDVVDDLFDEFLVIVTETMKEDSDSISTLVPFLLTARYLERIADRSENIGNRVLLIEKNSPTKQ